MVGVDSGQLAIGDPIVTANDALNFDAGLGDGNYAVYGRKYMGRWLEVKVVLCTPAQVAGLLAGGL